jgi:GR25 family glycosyltransferase involved in LPS biosynthesis
MYKYITLFFISASTCLLGGLENYYKKITDKSTANYSTIKNIDFIYMINLDQRPEKYAQSMDEFAPFGITPYRFSAVNGWEMSIDDINQVGIKYEPWMKNDLMGTYYLPENNGQPADEILHVEGKNYFCHCMSRGAIGIVLSHMSILKDAYDSGYETIWVMEDDIEVLKDPHLLSNYIEKLDQLIGRKNWDFLFTDQDTKNRNGDYVPCLGYAYKPDFDPGDPYKFIERRDISPDFRYIGARYGAYSMIVTRSGMKKMLDFLENGIFLPYDMEFIMPDNIRMYNIREDVVSTYINAFSDNGSPYYKQN